MTAACLLLKKENEELKKEIVALKCIQQSIMWKIDERKYQ
jgi:hypothetical protein